MHFLFNLNSEEGDMETSEEAPDRDTEFVLRCQQKRLVRILKTDNWKLTTQYIRLSFLTEARGLTVHSVPRSASKRRFFQTYRWQRRQRWKRRQRFPPKPGKSTMTCCHNPGHSRPWTVCPPPKSLATSFQRTSIPVWMPVKPTHQPMHQYAHAVAEAWRSITVMNILMHPYRLLVANISLTTTKTMKTTTTPIRWSKEYRPWRPRHDRIRRPILSPTKVSEHRKQDLASPKLKQVHPAPSVPSAVNVCGSSAFWRLKTDNW